MGLDLAKDNNHPLIGFMLHKGADGFMSPEQFSTFYWPPLKKVMISASLSFSSAMMASRLLPMGAPQLKYKR